MSDLNTTVQAGSRRSQDSTWVARVSELQHTAITRALTGRTFDQEQVEQMSLYVATGDIARLSGDTADVLREVVKQAKEGLSDSQAKRIWPRKVASVALLA